ncbi:MAG TPA: sulfurtransferase [Nocardioidaceae bacterium]|nr:sulfurtransferase [Nocardioidaceae bacterium]
MIPPVVTAAWLEDHRDRVVFADVRWYLDGRSGHQAFLAGHLPGARFVDLERWLAARADPALGRHPLPDPEVFAEGMRRLGVDDGDAVVGYDDAGGTVAARLVWMLRATGHDAALLDGGIAAWAGPLERGRGAVVRPGGFTTAPWPPQRLVQLDDLDGLDGVLVDARAGERYRGETEPVDPRAGHIPGARSLPCRDNLATDGTFLPPGEIRRRFESVGVRNGEELVCYCGSGVTACHDLLAAEHAGIGTGRLFAGSWSQYSHTDRPAATGEEG